ncbi:hypothetical protein E8E14_004289 [Neopestalotiopsis sp. 37M]|nr:hypothetical protein E8E14_004289 [Neopestalotiopsis sp. 37M]
MGGPDAFDASPKAPTAETASNHESVENGTIEEFGYTSIYRRVFAAFGNLCMVVSLASPLSAILVTAFYQITYAGYWGLSWGWIIPNIVLFPQVLAISELASSMPVNGAFYWWTGALCPPAWSHPISFVVGWLNVISMFSSTAAFAYGVAATFTYTVTILLPDFLWTNAEIMALSMSVIAVWFALMGLRLENISLVYITMALICLVQTLLYVFGLPISRAVQGLPFASGRDVFGSFETYTGWGPAVAVPYSWFCALWVNSAWMVPVYIAEETHRASTEIPKSLIYTYLITAVSGVVVCLISAFCITDIESAALDETGYPLIDLLVAHWGPTWTGAFALIGTPIGWIGGSGTLLTYGSQIAAFARDGGFPFSRKMSEVNQRINAPLYSIAFLSAGTFLILLLSLSEEAGAVVYSLSVVASLITFLTPVIARIFAGDRWVPGPFNLGRWSIPIHVITVITQVYLIVMECFPSDAAWSIETFNFNSVLTIASAIISLVLYMFIGKAYKGLDLESLARWRITHGHEVIE